MQYRLLTFNFARRELKTRYRKSILGWAWSLINPAALVATYSLVFGVIFRAPPPPTVNQNAEFFSLYLFTGLVVWMLFTTCINGSMTWLQGVSDLRKKIYFPSETSILGGAISAYVQTLIEVFILLLLMFFLNNIGWTFLLFPILLLGVASFGIGIGFFISILNQKYRDVSYLVGIILQLTFFLVPIVYTINLIPEEAYGLPIKSMIRLNPMTQFILAGEDLVYYLKLPSLESLLLLIIYSIFPFVGGLFYFRRRSMSISEVA
jgi:ABC-2 type transport system permease protein